MAYLDAGATQRLNEAGREALLESLQDGWADPSRLHREGRRARLMIDEAKQMMADLVGVRSDELHLMRSGTQAVRAGIEGLAHARRRHDGTCVITAVEHSSVIATAQTITDRAAAVDATAEPRQPHVVPVGSDGLLDLDDLRRAVAADALLAAVQSVNQETGTKQPIDAVARICREAEVPLLVDAAQSVGREPPPTRWDVMTASAHKWGGPAGVGLLAVRTGVRWRAPTRVRGLDRGSEGFPDVPSVVAAAASLRQAERDRREHRDRLMALTDRIRTAAAAIPDVEVVGHPVERAAHLVTFSCLYVSGEAIVEALSRLDISVASGSACSSDAGGPSHVLAAMGVLTHGNVRIGLPVDVDEADVDRLIDVLAPTVAAIRSEAGVDRL